MNEREVRNLFRSWWSKRLKRYAVSTIGIDVIQNEYARLSARVESALANMAFKLQKQSLDNFYQSTRQP